jgi:FO synthase
MSRQQWLSAPLTELCRDAAAVRDDGFGTLVTYSRKVFVPVTKLCRDVCHYCTFAQTPKHVAEPYLLPEQVIDIAQQGKEAGCKEVLFTLGDKPELRYRAAREALAELGYETTIDYVAAMAARVVKETGLLPHLNPGVLSAADYEKLRPLAPSMGLMLESAAPRLSEPGQPHYGSPDKLPALRLDSIADAGRARVPLTTGLLVGIGETRAERLDSLQALHDLHARYGHIQELIIQNFVPKAATKMHASPAPEFEELLWTIAVARLMFGSQMSIQVPPNLNAGRLEALVAAGINDWGGVSPVTPDHVNPEAPWPHLQRLADQTKAGGKQLIERLTIYPRYIEQRTEWLDPGLHATVLQLADADGMARDGDWAAGRPAAAAQAPKRPVNGIGDNRLLDQALSGDGFTETEIASLFRARGIEYDQVCSAADQLRQKVCGDTVSYVVNRNINYTNVCTYKCTFCAFSKGKAHEDLRGAPYLIDIDEIKRRTEEAWARGATEVCMQGGIHPDFTGETYLQICKAVKAAVPGMHVHAFSALEITQGAATLGKTVPDFLAELKDAGLSTLPGTAAEILDDEIRATLCADKIDTQQWLAVMAAAHELGMPTTSTIMFGHMETPTHWARHLLRVREQQAASGGFTEFVPLPFVHMEAPLFRRGQARPGPTYREAVLMHAVARLVLHPLITNIQVSWPKLGPQAAVDILNAGANDLGGTLMNESISKAAGAAYGQELPPEQMEAFILEAHKVPLQRTTLYGSAPEERRLASFDAQPVEPVVTQPFRRLSSQASL